MAKIIRPLDLEAGWRWPRQLNIHTADTKQGCLDWMASFRTFSGHLPRNSGPWRNLAFVRRGLSSFCVLPPESELKHRARLGTGMLFATCPMARFWQALTTMQHVMCEKPISVDLITTEEVVAKSVSKPHLKFLLPFSRRYDESYRATKRMAENGQLGEIHGVEASCLHSQDKNGRYFLDVEKKIPNTKKQVNRVVAFGQQAVYSELAKFGDADNAWGLVEFANDKILQTTLSRTITNGFEAFTRVCGTRGHSVINGNSTLNWVEIRDEYGVRTTSTADAFALYDRTFINDIAEFATAVLEDLPPSCSPQYAHEAGKIACALQHSFARRACLFR
ncbi:hypothetical protein TruAng_011674 [Truncatella angustata]|nr:hypothetical protein TruAng_011674 [Truncatella angustata]